MVESPSTTDHPLGRIIIPARATARFLGLLFVSMLGLQLLLYRNSFAVKPSSDDFIALHQIDRGETEGFLSFFKASDTGDYRPLQNATYWLFARWSRPRPLLSVRILHFLSSIFYACVAFLWIRTMDLNRAGAVVAAAVVFLHPTLTGPLAGLDNYARLVVAGWVWLGTWIAYVGGRRLPIAVPLVSLCFAIGLGYMEYALALIPLAVLAIAWRRDGRRYRDASIMFVSLMAVFGTYYMIRVSGLVVTTSGAGLLSLEPLTWVKNTAMMTAAVLFFGNTVPLMQEFLLPRLAWSGSNVVLVGLTVGYGLWVGCHNLAPRGRVKWWKIHSTGADFRSQAGFLSAAFAASFFPMSFLSHISEIYLSSVTLAFAIVCGLSAHGWTTLPRRVQGLPLVLAASQVLLASSAIENKIAGIKEAGERTDVMMQRLLEHVPNDVDRTKVAMVFLRPKTAVRNRYSIFAVPDDELIQRGCGAFAIQWFRPGRDIQLDSLLVTDPSEVNVESYDLALLWEEGSRRFTLMRHSAGGLQHWSLTGGARRAPPVQGSGASPGGSGSQLRKPGEGRSRPPRGRPTSI
jgi:hypothetical protein